MIRRLLFLITFCFLVTGWSYTFDFENGTPGTVGSQADQDLGAGEFDAVVTATGSITFDTVGNGGYVKNGTYSARCFLDDDSADENYSTRGSFKFPPLDPAEGSELWWAMYIYLGQAGDNPGGGDWSWGRQDTNNAGVQKIFRIIKYLSDGVTGKGMNSIFGQANGQPYVSVEFGDGPSYQDSPAISLSSGRWYYIEVYNKFSSDPAVGKVKMWIDGVEKLSHTKRTMLSTVTTVGSTASTDGRLWSTWNGTVTQDQNAWVDDLYISNEGRSSVYGGGGGADTTAPVFTGSDPADGATGISTSKTVELNASDNANTIDTTKCRVIFNNSPVTPSYSGTTNITASFSPSMSNSTNYAWSFGSCEDQDANVMLTTSGNFTTSGAIAANVFHTGDAGDLSNYTTTSGVQPADESGDVVVSVVATSRSYAAYNTFSYAEFGWSGAFRSDDYNEDSYADLTVIFDYQDADNYKQITLSKDANDSGVWEIVDGVFNQLYSYGVALLEDESEHTFALIYQNGNLSFAVDGSVKFTRSDIIVGNGKVGVGSLNNSGIFDALALTDETQGVESATAGTNIQGSGSLSGNGLIS